MELASLIWGCWTRDGSTSKGTKHKKRKSDPMHKHTYFRRQTNARFATNLQPSMSIMAP